MAVVLSWRGGSLFPTRARRSRPTITHPHLLSIDLDVSEFGTPLPVHEILLEPPKSSHSGDIPISEPPTRLRVILIPSPPRLPTHEMLVAATQALHPHVFSYKSPPNSSAESESESSRSSADSATSWIAKIDGTGTETDQNTTPSDSSPSELQTQCMVCMENRDPTDYPEGTVTSSCFHPAHTCSRCLEYSIASDHTSKMWYNIQCPQCYSKLSYNDVKKFADRDTFAHYDLLTTRQTLSNMPNFVWCTSCPSGQIHDPESLSSCPSVTCNDCSAITCYNHRIPWHTGLSCQQYDRLLKRSALAVLTSLFPRSSSPSHIHPSITSPSQPSSTTSDPTTARVATTDLKEDVIERIKVFKREQRASLKGIRRECKPCPGRGCGTMIYKIDGCKHMTCAKCTHEWCWGCGIDWFYGHKCWIFWKRSD